MPITYACGVSVLAHWGVLVKSLHQMERLSSLKLLCVDKTGTITEGRFRMQTLIINEQVEGGLERIISLTAATEKNSSHPLAVRRAASRP